ncbi:MAG: transglutaminase-like domain-containing protein [Desulfobacterales bacterium]|nr:transglutaminase-like domain-containing protein [Desulfobacterales bacterium]
MKTVIMACFALLLTDPGFAENYLLNGGQESRIQYQMVQEVQPASGTQRLMLNYVVPTSFRSPTYNQEISQLDITFSPRPSARKENIDKRGNNVVEVFWEYPTLPVKTAINFTALNSVRLDTLRTNTPFPLPRMLPDVAAYLQGTRQVDTRNASIRRKAFELTAGAGTQFDAIQRILTWMVDHMHYVLNPESYDATYSLDSGKGNCQNFSHLAAALMRTVGIPVRIVNGITLKEPYDIQVENSIMTMKMAQGRHSWIEVYFPEMGWVPFDPQGSVLFVSNRFIRVEVGLDNSETFQDGLVRWTRSKGVSGRPRIEENIRAGFVSDQVRLFARKADYGPRDLLLVPQVEAVFSKLTPQPLPPLPEQIPGEILSRLRYTSPYVFGNLEFPENVDFMMVQGPARQRGEDTLEIRKNFLVETAEYVTTRGKQYAQTFILGKPMQLSRIGLALHKFSDEGQLWLELFRDNNGRPADYIATSEIITSRQMNYASGYSWVDFAFEKSKILLSPGRYWVALGFTESPIVNWFFTYGKPVGPPDGTRYRTLFDEEWSRSLAFEFNYRVMGMAAEQ